MSFTDCSNLLLSKILDFHIWKGGGEELSGYLNPYFVPGTGKCSFEEDRYYGSCSQAPCSLVELGDIKCIISPIIKIVLGVTKEMCKCCESI